MAFNLPIIVSTSHNKHLIMGGRHKNVEDQMLMNWDIEKRFFLWSTLQYNSCHSNHFKFVAEIIFCIVESFKKKGVYLFFNGWIESKYFYSCIPCLLFLSKYLTAEFMWGSHSQEMSGQSKICKVFGKSRKQISSLW